MEYTIKMNFVVESESADYDRISQFAEQISETLMEEYSSKLNYDDIEIIDISVDEIEDNNEYEDEKGYFDDEGYDDLNY